MSGSNQNKFSKEDVSMVDLAIGLSLEDVKEAGYKVIEGRWPFTYHHDFIRSQVDGALTEGETMLSRGEVGSALRKWSEGTVDEPGAGAKVYVWEAISGALDYVLENYSEGNPKKLESLKEKIGKHLSGRNERFIDHVRGLVTEAQNQPGLRMTGP